MCAGGTGSLAADDSGEDPLATLEAVTEIADSAEQEVLGSLATNNSETTVVTDAAASDTAVEVVTENGNDVKVPVLAEDGVTITDIETWSIGLPFAEKAGNAEVLAEGIVGYDNRNNSTTVPLVKSDGSVQITTVIDSADAPTRYDYELSLPSGVQASLDEVGQVTLTHQDGSFFGGITAAWATDANGQPVDTHYELTGSTLTQVVEHTDATAFPVVADPYAGNDLIRNAWLSIPGNYYVVNANPTNWGRGWNGLITHASHVAELKAKLGSLNAWRVDANGGTIREQFLCHVMGNFFEWSTYNMESNRPSVYWPNQLNLASQCNPRY